LNLYGTDISDASIENLRKLKKLEKVFLWQTKVTSTGAESLRKNFVDQKIYANLTKEKSNLTSEIDKITKRYDLELENLNAVMQKNSDITEDTSPINDKCPVSNKPVDATKFSNFEGRMVGLCCDNCKSKFIKDPSSYKSKIANFKPSKAFENSLASVTSKEAAKEVALEEVGEKLREVSSKLNAMGPEINLGWSIAKSQK
jgi:hypothetical protein